MRTKETGLGIAARALRDDSVTACNRSGDVDGDHMDRV